MSVGIVTDSAADIPAALASSHGIRVVPLTIRFGQQAFLDGIELSTADFWSRLRSGSEFPATAAPSSGDFERAYRELLEGGHDEIVSVHLSSKLSATYQSAVLGAKALPDARIDVIDSHSVSAATGLMALTAASLAGQGGDAKEIGEELHAMRARTRLFGVLDTLDYLRRGGRIGGAQALLGTMLQVKPVISLHEGAVEPAGRVRTRQRALDHLAGIIRREEKIERLVILNGDAHDLDAFLGLISDAFDVTTDNVWALGPVVGTHTGPGLLGAVYLVPAA